MKPACMTDEEWAQWNAPVPHYVPTVGWEDRGPDALWRRESEYTVTWAKAPGGRPCSVCPMDFHLAMRAAGTCDGRPIAVNGRPMLPPDEAVEKARAKWREYARRKRAKEGAAA